MRIKILLFLMFSSIFFSEALTDEGKWFPYDEPRFLFPADSSHSFDVRHYRLDLALPMNNGSMNAYERISLTSRIANFDTFSLHMVSLTCDSVKRAGVRLTFTAGGGLLKITLDRQFPIGESLEVDIFYRRIAGTPNRGFYWYPRSGTTYHNLAYSTTQPYDSRYWFPCFDEPWDKAERGCEINLTVPDTMSGCSNGLLIAVIDNGNGTKTYRWRETHPISTYLMNFAASRWATFSHWYCPSPAESIEVKYYIWPEDSTRAVSAFRNVVDMMTLQSRRFGAYPFSKYGMVAVYPFTFGGMEHQTMTTIHQAWLNGDDSGIAHELAHQWWGDMVTCLDWRNIWLNEGFAMYGDALYQEYKLGRTQFITQMNDWATYYFQQDRTRRFPIYDPPPGQMFNWGIVYCKGGWILHMLRYVEELGGDSLLFFNAMKAYGDSFKYGNANTADFERVHEKMSGLSLADFFNEWVYLAGHPVYTVNWSTFPDSGNWRVVIDISQNNGPGAPPIFHIPVQILLRLTTKDTLVTIPVNSNPQRNTFLVSSQDTGIVFDPDTWVLKRVTVNRVGVEKYSSSSEEHFFELIQRGKNPFSKEMIFEFNIPIGGKVSLTVYNILGERVKTLLDKNLSSGKYIIKWDGMDELNRQSSSGVYFVQLETSGSRKTKRFIILK